MIEKIMSDTPPLTKVMHVNGGGFLDTSEGLPTDYVKFTARFLEQPTGRFYETEYVSGSGSGDDVKDIKNGQTSCKITDFAANQSAFPSAYTFDLTGFHDYVIYNDGNNMYIKIDGTIERTVLCANGYQAASGISYKWYAFDNAKLYIKSMGMWQLNVGGSRPNRFDWDFENGDSVPAGWSNSTIAYVIG